jgi:hypothetical protein
MSAECRLNVGSAGYSVGCPNTLYILYCRLEYRLNVGTVGCSVGGVGYFVGWNVG